MKSETQSGTVTVAASAADRAPVLPALINPLVALATALINPILGWFSRRAKAAAVDNHNQNNRPPSAPAPGVVSVRAYTRSAPVGRTAAQKGGRRHG